MIIKAKYFSVCPCCNKNIMVGADVKWEKGQKAIHVECDTKTVEQIINIFKETHKSGSIEFIKETNGIYDFKWIRKDGKEKLVQYYSNGERYHKDRPKPLLGVRV
jgi:hypothetical protein